MKMTTMNVTVFLAAVSLMSACSWSGPVESPAPKEDQTMAAKQAPVFTPGSFQGADAYCTDGSKSEKVRDGVVHTLLTFLEDGTYTSDTNISENEISHVKGEYTVEGNVLTMNSEGRSSQKYTFTVEGDNLTLSRAASENDCPAGQALFVKYVKFQPASPLVLAPDYIE